MNWREFAQQENVVFCPDMGKLNVASIVDLLSGKFLGSDAKDILIQRYEKMQRCFRGVRYDAAQWSQTSPSLSNDLISERDKKAAVLDVLLSYMGGAGCVGRLIEQYYNVGLDLPVWMQKDNPEWRVMIIGQDPQRNKHSMKGHLFLSSPWGLHSYWFDKCGRTRTLLAALINDLKAGLYVSDFAKLYFTEESFYADPRCARPGIDQRIAIQEDCLNRIGLSLRAMIKKERELYDPNVTVVMGESICKSANLDYRAALNCQDKGFVCQDDDLGAFVVLDHPNRPGVRNDYFIAAFQKVRDIIMR